MRMCPECGAVGTVALRPALIAQPLGSSSLAGVQIKVSAQKGWELACSACPFRVFGRVEGLEVDQATGVITAGNFMGLPPQG